MTGRAVRMGRLYFAVQSAAGALWWIAVFQLPVVRQATLGSLDPVVFAFLDIPLFVVASALAAARLRVFVWVACGWTVIVTMGMVAYATFSTEAGWGALLMAGATGGSVTATALVMLGRIPTELIISGPFNFRTAIRGRSTHLARTYRQMLAFWGVFLVAGPAIIVLIERRWQLAVAFPLPVMLVGILILIVASLLGVWSAHSLATYGEGTPLPSSMPAKLVIAGPYRFVRNPMALAGITQGVAVGLAVGSWLVVVYALVGSAIWNWMVRPHEEADLDARFGDEYVRYRRGVRCWIPRLTPWPAVSERSIQD